jgi:hypothetical protein
MSLIVTLPAPGQSPIHFGAAGVGVMVGVTLAVAVALADGVGVAT